MAHGRDYSAYQKGIIKRYYENKDHIMLQKLGEIVSDLYLCENEKKGDRLWKSAEAALLKLGANEKYVAYIVGDRDLGELANIVGELF